MTKIRNPPYLNVQTEPVNSNMHAFGDWVHPTHPVEHNVDCADEDLPNAVQGEKVSQKVEVLALK